MRERNQSSCPHLGCVPWPIVRREAPYSYCYSARHVNTTNAHVLLRHTTNAHDVSGEGVLTGSDAQIDIRQTHRSAVGLPLLDPLRVRHAPLRRGDSIPRWL